MKAAAIALAFILALSGAVQARTPTDVVAMRQAGFKQIGSAMKAMARQLRSSSPDVVAVRTAAVQIRTGGRALPSWFQAGSGADAGLKTAAKPEIWTRPADFRRAARDFASAADRMAQAAGAGDRSAMAARMRSLGESCAACHRTFRDES